VNLGKVASVFLSTSLLVSCASNQSADLSEVTKAGAQFGRSIAKTDPNLTFKVGGDGSSFRASMVCSGMSQRPSKFSDGSVLGTIESSVINGASQRYTDVEERSTFINACKEALGYKPVD
jgi:hypothetical protein